jgi:hypothetical protein
VNLSYQLNQDPKPRRPEPRRTQNHRSRDPSGSFPAVDIPGTWALAPLVQRLGTSGEKRSLHRKTPERRIPEVTRVVDL